MSAFGISGTNAHVVVEGYEADGAGPDDGSLPAGSAQPVAVSLPEPLADLPLAEEALRTRETRLLPLSGKADGALRELAGRYLSWLDEHAGALSSDGAAEAMLADVAWTAGVGRSHCDYRASVVFRDVASLRDGLENLANGDERPEPAAATKVAFAYTGQGSQWVGMGRALYDSEPVVRAVLDRCDAVVREERGASLLDAMFGRAGSEGALGDPDWTRPAVYVMECALTALWSSVGIRPTVVTGQDLGEIAAAQAAGVFGLEEGLRFAVARGGEGHLEGAALATPSLALVSSVTGRVMASDEALDEAYWRRQADEPAGFRKCVETLADLGVEVVVEIGPHAVLGPMVGPAWPNAEAPVVVESLRQPSGDGPAECEGGFAAAVAGAYEAGLAVSFAGLFAGEARRRISVPGYPFQRRRHWIEAPKRPA